MHVYAHTVELCMWIDVSLMTLCKCGIGVTDLRPKPRHDSLGRNASETLPFSPRLNIQCGRIQLRMKSCRRTPKTRQVFVWQLFSGSHRPTVDHRPNAAAERNPPGKRESPEFAAGKSRGGQNVLEKPRKAISLRPLLD
jgi:hypothetical protein